MDLRTGVSFHEILVFVLGELKHIFSFGICSAKTAKHWRIPRPNIIVCIFNCILKALCTSPKALDELESSFVYNDSFSQFYEFSVNCTSQNEHVAVGGISHFFNSNFAFN